MNNKLKCNLQPKILVVEDDLNLREALVDTLELEKFRVLSADCAEKALIVVESHSDIDLIVSDVNMGEMSGHDLLKEIKRNHAHIQLLLITAYASISESVQAIREGAVDYLVKPFEPQSLVDTVRKYVGRHSISMDEPVAISECSKQLLQLSTRVAQSDSTVLLVGESGTGKEVLARYIHEKSPRANKPFVAINCAAIPENMLEAMLFGHEKGAYTGAHTSSPGKFEQADGGTILLDEISEMDMGLQAKLLRVLQEREVERLGGKKNIKLDVRVIATSNRDMRKEVVEGKFREDLYFRLSVLPLQWAPLRDRKEDILPLAENLLQCHANKQHRVGVSLSEETKSALIHYPWPGNVRELDNVMQRALILQPGNAITVQDLGLMGGVGYSEKPSLLDAGLIHSANQDFKNLVANQTQSAVYDMAKNFAVGLPSASDVSDGIISSSIVESEIQEFNSPMLGSDMRRHEFEIIVKTLRQENGSKKNTAEKLGISPRTLRYKLAKMREEGYNLEAALAS